MDIFICIFDYNCFIVMLCICKHILRKLQLLKKNKTEIPKTPLKYFLFKLYHLRLKLLI